MAVGDNAPPASVVVMVWQMWMVGIRYASRHRSPLAPTMPSVDLKGWYGAGLSGAPP